MYSVYALTDPRDGAIRYIGMSRNVWRRYALHLVGTRKMHLEKDAWIDELRKFDLSPLLKIIEEMEEEEEALERENYWIQYHLDINAPLTNVRRTGKPIFHKKKFADLSQAVKTIEDEYITMEQIVEATGVSIYTIRRYIRQKELVAFKVGAVWRIDHRDLKTFVEERKIKKQTE